MKKDLKAPERNPGPTIQALHDDLGTGVSTCHFFVIKLRTMKFRTEVSWVGP